MANKEHKIILGLDARKFQSQMQKVQGSFSGMQTAIKGIAALWGTQIAGKLIMDISDLGTKVENVTAAFNAMATPGLLNELNEATGGVVSNLELMQQAVKFKNFNLDVKQLSKFLEFAQFRAKTTGQSVDYLVNSIVEGLGKQSKKVIDNLTLDMVEFNKKVGEGASFSQALADIIDTELGDNGIKVQVSEAEKLNKEFEDLKTTLANDLKPLANDFLSLITGALGLITDYRRRVREKGKQMKMAGPGYGFEGNGATGGWSSPEAQKAIDAVNKFTKGIFRLSDAEKKLKKEAAKANKKLEKQRLEFKMWKADIEAIGMVGGGGFSDFITEQTKFGDLSGLENFEGLGGDFWDPPEAENFINTLKEVTPEMEKIAGLGGDIAGNFANALLYGENFGESMIQMLKQLAVQLAATAAVAGVLAVLTGGGSAATGFGGIFKGMLGIGGGGGAMKTTITGQDINITSGRNKTFLNRTGGR